MSTRNKRGNVCTHVRAGRSVHGLVAAFGALAAVSTTHAQIIHDAWGHHLDGATITIQWRNLLTGDVVPSAPTLIEAVGLTGKAIIDAPPGAGDALFSTSADDTWFAEWQIQNNSFRQNAIWSILSVTFDLRGSISLFDDGTDPSTPNSFQGRLVPIRLPWSTAPDFTTALKHDLWGGMPGTPNAGDMFYMQTIRWGINTHDAFLPGQSYSWRDDTDLIPAPGTLALLAFGAVAVSRRRRV